MWKFNFNYSSEIKEHQIIEKLFISAIQHEQNGYSKPLYLYLTHEERDHVRQERMKFAMSISLGTSLVIVNVMQIMSDTLLFQITLQSCHGKALWIIFVLDIMFWIATLITFVNVFPAGGILMLTIVLIGTSVRCYILYIIHQYFTQLRKSGDSNTHFKISSSPPTEPVKSNPFIT